MILERSTGRVVSDPAQELEGDEPPVEVTGVACSPSVMQPFQIEKKVEADAPSEPIDPREFMRP